MIISNGYVLLYDLKNNRIVIDLPQTKETLTDTFSPVTNRKVHITTEEQAAILSVVKAIVAKGEEHETD